MHIIGQTNVIKHGPLTVWPERGRIHFVDAENGNKYYSESVATVRERAEALYKIAENTLSRGRTTDSHLYSDEIRKYKDLAQRYEDICKIAEEQGEPLNPDAIKERMRRRPAQVRIVNDLDLD